MAPELPLGREVRVGLEQLGPPPLQLGGAAQLVVDERVPEARVVVVVAGSLGGCSSFLESPRHEVDVALPPVVVLGIGRVEPHRPLYQLHSACGLAADRQVDGAQLGHQPDVALRHVRYPLHLARPAAQVVAVKIALCQGDGEGAARQARTPRRRAQPLACARAHSGSRNGVGNLARMSAEAQGGKPAVRRAGTSFPRWTSL